MEHEHTDRLADEAIFRESLKQKESTGDEQSPRPHHRRTPEELQKAKRRIQVRLYNFLWHHYLMGNIKGEYTRDLFKRMDQMEKRCPICNEGGVDAYLEMCRDCHEHELEEEYG